MTITGRTATILNEPLPQLETIQGVTDSNLWIDAKHLSAEAFYDDLKRMMRATYFRKIKAKP